VKGVLGWVKKNLLIVVSVVLILVFLPAGWIFSSKWNASIKKAATDEFNKQKQALQRASSVKYTLPAVFEGEQTISESRAPNRAVTEFYARQKAARVEQVRDVVDRGTAFNRRDHGLLRPEFANFLPKAPSERMRRQLGLDLAEMVAGTVDPDGTIIRPSVYFSLFRSVNAGPPTAPEDLGASLQEFKTRETDNFVASNADGRISDEQSKRLEQELVARRLGEYAGKANTLSFYINHEAVLRDNTPGWTGVPEPRRTDVTDYPAVTESIGFVWHWDYWVIDDILTAIAAGNTDPATGAATVTGGAVKRVEKIRLSEFAVTESATESIDDLGGWGGGRDQGYSDPRLAGGSGAGAPVGATYTGRAGSTGDGAYDIRMVELTAIVAPQKLPQFFEALGRTNYMTVVDIDLSPVDVWADLNQGYFYGSDHVMRATMLIETVWLRSWTEQYMPDAVRSTLGLPPREQPGADGIEP